MISSGFTFSGLFILNALDGWSTSPVITTLDSIAASIDLVDFPTVTICPEEFTPPDNWAILETLLNSLAFHCDASFDEEVSIFPQCSDTEKLRDDFQELMRNFVDKFKQWVFKSGDSWPILMRIFDSQNMAAEFTAELLTNGTISSSFLTNLPYESLAKTISLDFALQKYLDKDEVYCTSKACKSKLSFVRKFIQLFWLEETDDKSIDGGSAFFFGSFLANTVHVDSITTSFDDSVSIQDVQDGYLCELTKQDKLLHDFFKSLGIGLGFSEDELISLFDIPSILAFHDIKTNWNSPVSQSFLHTQCEASKEVRKGDLGICTSFWNEWVNQPSNKTDVCNTPEKAIKCCNIWTSKFGHNLRAVMKVMRFASRRGKSDIDIASFLSHFNESKLLNGYKMNPIGRGNYRHPHSRDFNSMIPWCSWRRQGQTSNGYLEACTLFDPVITNMGICHSFNALPMPEMLPESAFKDAFLGAFQDDMTKERQVLKGTGSGNNHAIDFMIVNTDYMKERRDLIPKSFRVSISSSGSFFDARDGSKVVHVGQKTVFSVKPMEVVPTENLQFLSIAERKCRFPHETHLAVDRFKVYTQAACEFECAIRHAERICGCTPWFIPGHPDSSPHLNMMCDIYGNSCFNHIFAKGNERRCNCYPTCHDIQHSVNERITDLQADELCQNPYSTERKLAKIYRRQTHKMIFKLHRIEGFLGQNESLLKSDPMDYALSRDYDVLICKNLLKRSLAVVSVRFESNKYIRTITDRKVSFTDKLAAIGGTLGLFTGMSILSMIEMAYWLLTYLPKAFLSQQR